MVLTPITSIILNSNNYKTMLKHRYQSRVSVIKMVLTPITSIILNSNNYKTMLNGANSNNEYYTELQ